MHIKAPHENPSDMSPLVKIFLAGSIEMGKAEPWQEEVAAFVQKPFPEKDVCVYNPRRVDWDSSWKQTKDDPQFSEQVNWELNHIDISDIVFFYFDPATQSPITLLELGHVVGGCQNGTEQKVIVCCPDGYFRKGNVEIFCNRRNIFVYNSIDSAKFELMLYTKRILDLNPLY